MPCVASGRDFVLAVTQARSITILLRGLFFTRRQSVSYPPSVSVGSGLHFFFLQDLLNLGYSARDEEFVG